MQERRRQLIEKMGIIFEKQGKPAVSGRIMGLFLTSNQEYLTFDNIVEELCLSKSAVSNGINLLLNFRHIDYIKKTGDRKRYFKYVHHNLSDLFNDFTENFKRFKNILEEMASENEMGTKESKRHINEMLIGLNIFMSYLPKMMEDYEKAIKK